MAVIDILLASGIGFDPSGASNLDSPDLSIVAATDTHIAILKSNGYVENFYGTGLLSLPGSLTGYAVIASNDQSVALEITDIEVPLDAGSTGAEVILSALGGADVVRGGAGPDRVYSLGGEDTVFAGQGSDMIYGNAGRDVIYGNQGGDVLFGGRDDDRLFAGADNDIIYGNNGRDALYGNRGDDGIFGGRDGDYLYGGQGDDTLLGNKGDDVLFGNRDQDTLIGGEGNDFLTGGSGRDSFLFAADASTDVITDFVVGEDIIGVPTEPEIAQDGTNAIIQFAGTTIVVLGVDAASLGASVFQF